MIFLSRIKRRCGVYFCVNRAPHEALVRLPLAFTSSSGVGLSGCVGKNGAAVLIPTIAKLLVGDGGVDIRPKNFKQFCVANFFWIKHDLNGFRMTGAAIGYLLISCVNHVAAYVAGGHLIDACKTAKWRFHAPKTAACKRCLFQPCRCWRGWRCE